MRISSYLSGPDFVADNIVNQGPLALALVMFAEFQHDAQSGATMNEDAAQIEFAQVRDAIRRINPNAITPYIENLHHGYGF